MGEDVADICQSLVGGHPNTLRLRQMARRVAVSPARTVLIYGETGTGKGLVAETIHRLSPRSTHEFVDINCAAIPASLLESELFGHEKGAFTGAVERKLGLVEVANRGSIFLDEIREMDMMMQAKLLSVLDTQKFRRVGAVRPVTVDVRFIAATNKVLLSEVNAAKFREDLYYRLQVVAVNLPALRDRGDDVLVLAAHFIKVFNKFYARDIKGLAPEVEDIFRRYRWPGNVRELRNLLERIFILEDEDIVAVHHMPDRILRAVRGDGAKLPTPDAAKTLPLDGSFRDATEAFQRQVIERALQRSHGSLQHAAESLDLSRHALRHQMAKLGIAKV
ncbi:sigma-54 interaction domain-containing protein [Pseudorhodobacter sp.]|uniref:sigma-54 interaction domain-containing protein n=1 Tax=Pseudorhodobacter sp. TaxID=1934400 RepID=UPI002AFE4973|nr:sigma 54-interacting transcriptional regulator [Pseudorhodobacter sp.]